MHTNRNARSLILVISLSLSLSSRIKKQYPAYNSKLVRHPHSLAVKGKWPWWWVTVFTQRFALFNTLKSHEARRGSGFRHCASDGLEVCLDYSSSDKEVKQKCSTFPHALTDHLWWLPLLLSLYLLNALSQPPANVSVFAVVGTCTALLRRRKDVRNYEADGGQTVYGQHLCWRPSREDLKIHATFKVNSVLPLWECPSSKCYIQISLSIRQYSHYLTRFVSSTPPPAPPCKALQPQG